MASCICVQLAGLPLAPPSGPAGNRHQPITPDPSSVPPRSNHLHAGPATSALPRLLHVLAPVHATSRDAHRVRPAAGPITARGQRPSQAPVAGQVHHPQANSWPPLPSSLLHRPNAQNRPKARTPHPVGCVQDAPRAPASCRPHRRAAIPESPRHMTGRAPAGGRLASPSLCSSVYLHHSLPAGRPTSPRRPHRSLRVPATVTSCNAPRAPASCRPRRRAPAPAGPRCRTGLAPAGGAARRRGRGPAGRRAGAAGRRRRTARHGSPGGCGCTAGQGVAGILVCRYAVRGMCSWQSWRLPKTG